VANREGPQRDWRATSATGSGARPRRQRAHRRRDRPGGRGRGAGIPATLSSREGGGAGRTTVEQIRIFAFCLWERTDLIEWRALQKGKLPRQGWTTAADLPTLADLLDELNRSGLNIYVGINPRRAVGDDTSESVRVPRSPVSRTLMGSTQPNGETIEKSYWYLEFLNTGFHRRR
jgi:hypothetical protein